MTSKFNDQARSTRSTKRIVDSAAEEFIEQETKAPRLTNEDKSFLVSLVRESEAVMTNFIKDSIGDSEKRHYDYIKKLISESEQRIRGLVETELLNLKSAICDVTERVNNLETECIQISCLQNEVKDLRRQLLMQENSTVASGLRISGIPTKDGENLRTIFNNICQNLNIQAPNIENTYRLTKIYRNNRPYKPNDEVIVVKLQSPYDKNFVLKSIAKYRRDHHATLTLNLAGFQSDQPIYINENLTPHNHQIFKAALRIKKEQKLHSVYTLRGQVYVRKCTTDEPIMVELLDDLDRLFR